MRAIGKRLIRALPMALLPCLAIARPAQDLDTAAQWTMAHTADDKVRNDADMDQLAQGLAAGKALVLMRIPGGYERMSAALHASIGEKKDNEMQAYADLLWANDATGRVGMGHFNSADSSLIQNDLQDFYSMTLVDPGTYRLHGARYLRRAERLPELRPAGTLRYGDIGMALVGQASLWDTQTTSQWQAPITLPTRVDYDYCTTIIVGSNQCVATATERRIEDRVAVEGGWSESSRDVQAPAIDAAPVLDRGEAFASFQVGAGEIVLVDTLFAKPQNFHYDESDCVAAGPQGMCSLTYFSAQYLPASADMVADILSHLGEASRPRLAAMQYRPLKISASKAWNDPTWGTQYYVVSKHRPAR